MKTNKKQVRRLLLSFFAVLLPLLASAESIEIDSIWYNLTAETSEAEVTFKGKYFDSYDNEYSGSITIPATVTYDGVTYSVTSIGKYAFEDCNSLTAIDIPEGVTSIGESAFNGTAWYNNLPDGLVYIGKVLYEYKGTMPENTSIDVKEGIVSISPYAFYNCSSLTAIDIPESVTSIGNGAFNNCSSLTAITIPEGVTSIGDCAFAGCSSLTAITLPESVTSIGGNAFYHCSSLTSITIPKGVTRIDGSAFRGCIFTSDNFINNSACTSYDNWGAELFDKEYDGFFIQDDTIVVDCRPNVISVAIPEGVTSIGDYAFQYCSSLTDITIPEGVTSIGDFAFAGCSSLTAITLPESVTHIGRLAFDGCIFTSDNFINNSAYTSKGNWGAKLFDKEYDGFFIQDDTIVVDCRPNVISVAIPEGVTSIGGDAFAYCSSLTAITIPEGVTSIGGGAFYRCSSLTDITIPESVKSIGDDAFRDCSSLTAIILPEGVTSIGNGAFYYCSSLTSIDIPEGVKSIENQAFHDCTSLKELTLGKGLKKIAAGAFSTCKALEKITIYATQPPATDGYIFYNATYENATLYVPQGSISKYQVMTGWSGFYNISEIEGGTPDYLTLRQADNGEVGIAVDMGRTYKVRITPSTGWKIHTVTFDGKDMTAQLADDNTFTTPTINGSAVLNVAYVKEGSAIAAATASRIKVQGHQGTISISGTTEGTNISLYTTDGTLVTRETAEDDTTHLTVPTGQVYIVKVADTVVKIGM